MPAESSDISEMMSTGSIRAAVNIANAALVRLDEQTGELVGPSVDLAKALAGALGCPLTLIQYPSAAAILEAAEGGWDIAFIAADPSRGDRFEFSSPYAFVTATYLIPASSKISVIADMDRPRLRISAARGAAYTKELERQLKHAAIVYAETPSAAIEMLRAGASDAAAGLTDFLTLAAAQEPNFRMLDDLFLKVPQAVAVHKGSRIAPLVVSFVSGYIKT